MSHAPDNPTPPRRRPTRREGVVRRAGLLALPLLLLVALLALQADAQSEDEGSGASNSMTCGVEQSDLMCEVDIRGFLGEDIRTALGTGWENELHIRLFLFDDEDNLLGLTYAKLNQRCYLDFFEESCLALWEGADDWETYTDVDGLIEGIGFIRLRSLAASGLEGGTYRARLIVELNPLTDEQISQVRSWLARSRGGHLVMDQSDSSIFGTFVSIFANVRAGDAEAILTVDAPSVVVP